MYFKPTIYNLTLTSANTEYSQALPDDTREVTIKTRTMASELKLAFVENESGTKYQTIPVGASKTITEKYLKGLTLYVQSPDAGVVVEIEVWQ